MKKLTIAEKIARQFYNDGQCWTAKGRGLAEVLEKKALTWQAHQPDNISLELVRRHLFADGSVIIENGLVWDLEGEEPFSWPGA